MNALLNFLPQDNRSEVRTLLISSVLFKSLIFLAVLLFIFGGALFGMQFLFKQEVARIQNQQKTLETQTKGSGSLDVENAIKDLNNKTQRIEDIQKTFVYWTIELNRVQTFIPSGVTISEISINSSTKTAKFTGVATTRDAYYAFEKALQSSAFVENADLPISLLKSDIQFSITITFTDDFFSYET